MLHEVNPYVKTFTCIYELFKDQESLESYNLAIHADKKPAEEHVRRYNAPTSSEVAALIVGAENDLINKNDIILRHRAEMNENGYEKLSRIAISHRSYDALAYPILFPFGDDGWRLGMYVEETGSEQKSPLFNFTLGISLKEKMSSILYFMEHDYSSNLSLMFTLKLKLIDLHSSERIKLN